MAQASLPLLLATAAVLLGVFLPVCKIIISHQFNNKTSFP